jgi:RNA polymerase sigma-70 factor (ECF subfamily)
VSTEHVDDDAFLACRPRLLGVAYGMLGTRGEAEDVVQEAWLRWRAAGREAVRDAEAFLVRVTTRLALDALTSARARRETYVGPWLPEPLVTDTAAGPDEALEAAEELGFALLAALERLDPVQRAVLLLRDVFDLDYAEVADAVDKSPAACRQAVHRAREAVGHPRRRHRVTPADEERLTTAFAIAVATGDLAALTALLAEDAILWSDGGARVRAARKPILGPEKVARFLLGVGRKAPNGVSFEIVRVNGDPGWRITGPEGVLAVLALELTDDAVASVRVVNNPEKLERV